LFQGDQYVGEDDDERFIVYSDTDSEDKDDEDIEEVMSPIHLAKSN
jgi:hypothetical protein